MITGELKNKIDGLWNVFWTGGMTNPLDIAEQITYLMFIKDLDELDDLRKKEYEMLGLPYKSLFESELPCGAENVDGQLFKWSRFRDLPAERMYHIVQNGIFPFIKNLQSDKDGAYSKYMRDAIFKIPTPQKFSHIVDSLDDIYLFLETNEGKDMRGDVYEYILSKLSTSGTNGQFRTPRHIISMMVQLMEPKADEVVCDPACGTAGFLVAVGEYIRKNRKEEVFYDKAKKDHFNNEMFTGYDMDRTMLSIGAMNMMSHGVENPNIRYMDSLSDQNPDSEKYTLILANPPFTGSLDKDIVSADLLKATANSTSTELLFVALFLRMLRVGGRCASIVPDGVIFSEKKAYTMLRKTLVDDNRLEAVISMPNGVFKPYSGVSTAILIFTKTGHGGTENVWFYEMEADGFTLNDKRTPIEENDIPDIIERYRNLSEETKRSRKEKSFMVPKKEIQENNYSLDIKKYKEIEYEPVDYPPTRQLIAEIRELEEELAKNLEILEGML